MKIQLKQLTLSNFKGIKQLTINFNDVTNIHGENATGKSTIFDAFTWLLFGKDSHEVKDFNIKTLASDGKAIPMLEHSVEGVLDVDRRDAMPCVSSQRVPSSSECVSSSPSEIILKRIYHEKWQRKRGAEETEMTRHETTYFINGVPLQAGDYNSKIAAIVNEGLFKLLTSTLYFNSLKWQDRRDILLPVAGDISQTEIIAGMPNQSVKTINLILSSGKNLADFRKEIAVAKKGLTDELNAIPARVDEVEKSKPEAANFVQVKNDLSAKKSALNEIENAITNQVDAYKTQSDIIESLHDQIASLKEKQRELKFNILNEAQKKENEQTLKINDLKQKLTGNASQVNNIQHSLKLTLLEISATEEEITNLRNTWTQISNETFELDENTLICPTCNRKLEQSNITEKITSLQQYFEQNTSSRLTDISAKGKLLSTLLIEKTEYAKSQQNEIEAIENRIADISNQYDISVSETAPGTYSRDAMHCVSIQSQIESLQSQILEIQKLDINSLKIQKTETLTEIYNLEVILNREQVIQRANDRIKALLENEKTLIAEICELEKREFAIIAYSHSKMNLVEAKINAKFKNVQFRLFNHLLNGGVELCCICTVNGVPFSDVNSAGKIQAGIEIINTFSQFFKTCAPIWIDNRESTNLIPATQSQIINLIVSKDKSLKIN